MNINERNRYNMFITVRQFGVENAADFPVGSVGATQFAEIAAVIPIIDGHATNQTSGSRNAGMGFQSRDTARENLREAIADISRTSRSMEYQFPGVSTIFKMPRNNNDRDLLSAAWSFADDAVTYKTNFISYGMPADFIDDLTDLAQAFQDALDAPAAGRSEQVAATAELSSTIRRGMVAVRILDGVIKNKYRNNVGKLASWATASHIERTPRSSTATLKKTPETAPTG